MYYVVSIEARIVYENGPARNKVRFIFRPNGVIFFITNIRKTKTNIHEKDFGIIIFLLGKLFQNVYVIRLSNFYHCQNSHVN